MEIPKEVTLSHHVNVSIIHCLLKEFSPISDMSTNCPLCLRKYENMNFTGHVATHRASLKSFDELINDIKNFRHHLKTCHPSKSGSKGSKFDPPFNSCWYCRSFRASFVLSLCSKGVCSLNNDENIRLRCFKCKSREKFPEIEVFTSLRGFLEHLLRIRKTSSSYSLVTIKSRLWESGDIYLLAGLYIKHCLRAEHCIRSIYDCKICCWYYKKICPRQPFCPFCFIAVTDVELLAHFLAIHKHNFSSDSPILKDEEATFNILCKLTPIKPTPTVLEAREKEIPLRALANEYVNHFYDKHLGGSELTEKNRLQYYFQLACATCDRLKIIFLHSSLFDESTINYPCPRCTQQATTFSQLLYHLLKTWFVSSQKKVVKPAHTIHKTYQKRIFEVTRTGLHEEMVKPSQTVQKRIFEVTRKGSQEEMVKQTPILQRRILEIKNPELKRIITIAFVTHLQTSYGSMTLKEADMQYSQLIGFDREQACRICLLNWKPMMGRLHCLSHARSFRSFSLVDSIVFTARFLRHMSKLHPTLYSLLKNSVDIPWILKEKLPVLNCPYCVIFLNGIYPKVMASSLMLKSFYSCSDSLVFFRCLFHCTGTFSSPESFWSHMLTKHLEDFRDAVPKSGLDEIVSTLNYVRSNGQASDRKAFLNDKHCFFCLRWTNRSFLAHCRAKHPELCERSMKETIKACEEISLEEIFDLMSKYSDICGLSFLVDENE